MCREEKTVESLLAVGGARCHRLSLKHRASGEASQRFWAWELLLSAEIGPS